MSDNIEIIVDNSLDIIDVNISTTDPFLLSQLELKADIVDVLTKTNTISYNPTLDYHPATKKYVEDRLLLTGNHEPVTVTDSSEINFTLTGQNITASLFASSIDESKLDTSVNASLSLANSSLQPSAIGVTIQGYSSILQNTTASFTTSDETKLDNISITQPVNLDTIESDVALNNAARHSAVTLAGIYDYLTLSNQQITLNQINLATDVTGSLPQASVTNLVSDLALKAPLASPALTGIPTAPTAAFETNTNQIATTAFVDTAFNNVKTIYETVKNVSGVTLPKGTPLHITGNSGNEAEVIAADAALNYPAQLILNESLIDQAIGQAVAIGFINNVPVPNASLYSAGDEVYLASGGGWTTIRPTGNNAVQKIGVIIKVNISNNTVSGILYGLGNNEDLPNLAQGKIWVGDSNGVPTTVDLPIGSLSINYHNTSTLSPTNATVYQLDTGSNAITVTLPSAPANGTWYGFCDYRGTFSTNNVVINRSGTNTIINNTDTSVTLNNNYQNLWLAYYNGIWSVISAESFVDAGGGGSANSSVNALGTITTGTNTIDWSYAGTTATVNGTLTFDFSNIGNDKQETSLLLTWTSGAITWPTVTWIGGVTPSLTGKTYEIEFFTYDGGTTVYAGFSQLGA